MSFVCYPIVITTVEGRQTPSSDAVIKDLMESCEIVIRVIRDKNDKTYKHIQTNYPSIENIEYIIIAVKYLNVFNA